ncbi:hypothetical protein K435DRAFT_774824 [Dendrothele bispora CBS 962.96]|uniref:diacylglycerol cholinephosphotransferase n=1 Tax=Dendrothele bispora (strain CBS 962.96) TaxID=1314807 RepID=A0A4S8MLS6_DENBC|nr:hypothetical protein K435DRAFT_774824 [Dendrothele bispora CBS 962.96]
MGYLPEHALQNLKKYSYSGVDKSIVSKYLLGPFWTWFVTLWPKTVAPNTITLSGLMIVFINFFTMLYYDPSYLCEKGGVITPRWIYFTYGIGLFLYQAFDAIDGKQARRTGMAGPLGEMFDHGCDALNTTLEVIIASQALNLGRSWWTVASQIATLANFYLTTWEEYHTGSLYLGIFSGPVEGILMIISIYMITGIFGPSFWDTPALQLLHLSSYAPAIASRFPIVAPYVNMGINEAFMVFAGFGLAFNIIVSCSNVSTATRTKSTSKSKLSLPTANGGTPNGTSVPKGKAKRDTNPLLLLLPFFISVSIQIAWMGAELPFSFSTPSSLSNDSDADLSVVEGEEKFTASDPGTGSIIHSPLFVPFLLSWGLQFAYMVGRMILAHVTRSRPSSSSTTADEQDHSAPALDGTGFPTWDPMWIWSFLIGAVDANLPLIHRVLYYIFPVMTHPDLLRSGGWKPVLHSSPFMTTLVVYTTLVISLVRYGVFVTMVIREVTAYLGIACFRVLRRDGEGEWRNAGEVATKRD